jgi:hypothetical protein
VSGQVAGQPPQLREAVLRQAGEGRRHLLGSRWGVDLEARRLEGGEPQGVDQQDPERLDRPLALHATAAQ